MNGNVNSFTTMPGKRIPKICALEGSVKATPTKGVSIIKKELCEILTPVPTIVKPKPKPIELTKEQKDIIKNFKLPTPIKLATPIKFEIDQDELRRNIKKNLNFPKIKFNFPLNIGAPGATGDAGAARRYNVGRPMGFLKTEKQDPNHLNQKEKVETHLALDLRQNLKYLHHHQYLMYWLIYQTQEYLLTTEEELQRVEYHLIEQVVEGVDLVHLW